MSEIRITLVLVFLSFAAGCRVREYVVARDETPLYATEALDALVERMPLGYHGPIDDGAPGSPAVRVLYEGRKGYVRRADLDEVDYASPALDMGADRDWVLGRAVRSVFVRRLGSAWSAEVQEAIRDERVVEGMTREQVELAWGWPRSIEPLSNPRDGERWTFERRGHVDFPGGPFHAREDPWRCDGSGRAHGTSRLDMIEVRSVDFVGSGVVRMSARHYYDYDPAGE